MVHCQVTRENVASGFVWLSFGAVRGLEREVTVSGADTTGTHDGTRLKDAASVAPAIRVPSPEKVN
jgi:hypothetical protein